MIFSESWLREWVNPALSTDELIAQITMAGLEVDGVEKAAEAFSGVIVGEIIAIEQHPDADKLKVCQVKGANDEVSQVVCGAPNARLGLKAPFATVGAKLPGDFKIRKAKLRGVESCGMLCSESELTISDANEGLMELAADAPVGTCLREYLNLNDALIEVDLTPNRGDCLSILGLARDVAVLNRLPLNIPDIEFMDEHIDDCIDVALYDGEGCPRYASRIVKGVNVNATTPNWMAQRLMRSGIRSIDPIVDITNYVLLELGQPMHAFDLAKIDGGIVIRKAEPEETLVLLDEQEVTLREDTTVIADHKGALAIAGIMGGLASGVTSSTTDIVFESAHFAPQFIAGKARSYGLHTDSSHRFERGVDTAMQEIAIERATQLLLEICGGEAGPIQIVEAGEEEAQPRQVTLAKTKVNDYLGINISSDDVLEILELLGLEKFDESESNWSFYIPSWRFDISLDVDLVEEVARIYGYNNLPSVTPSAVLAIEPHDESRRKLPAVRQQLVARDYREAITYSFVDQKVLSEFDSLDHSVTLANPISSDMGVMRTNLVAGLVSAVKRNSARQQSRIRLFETGLSFVKASDEVVQVKQLAMITAGTEFAEDWHGNSKAADFFSLKGDLESLLPKSCVFKPSTRMGFHPGQTADIFVDGKLVGFIGTIHPTTVKTLDLVPGVAFAQVELETVLSVGVPSFKGVSKFPEVRRDLAFIVKRDVTSGELTATIDTLLNDSEIYQGVGVFDVYEGEAIDKQRKSIALGLTFRHNSRTLNDEEVNDCVNIVIDGLGETYEATLRN